MIIGLWFDNGVEIWSRGGGMSVGGDMNVGGEMIME